MPPQFYFDRSWPSPDTGAEARIAAALVSELGLSHEESEGATETVLAGGSQVRTRLLGGWFIAPRHLPKRVSLTVVSHADGGWRLDVRVEDALGSIAVRDRHFGGRYEAAAEEVFAIVERTFAR